MESKLLKIKLNPNSRTRVDELLEYMTSSVAGPKNEMSQKGYYWDSVFFGIEVDVEYLYIVLKSNDFSKIMVDESELIATPFREYYDRFRNDCWAPESYEDIESLFCFNTQIEYGI